MANLCSNRLRIRGDAEALTSLQEAIRGADADGRELALDFDKVVPTPEELAAGGTIASEQARDLLARWDIADEPERRQLLAGSDPLYRMIDRLASGQSEDEVIAWDAADWREHNWGSRWAPGSDELTVEAPEAAELIIYFDSRSRPAVPIAAQLASRFPDVCFELLYSEPDADRVGRLLYRDGQLVEQNRPETPYAAAALLNDYGWEGEAESWLGKLGEGD